MNTTSLPKPHHFIKQINKEASIDIILFDKIVKIVFEKRLFRNKCKFIYMKV